MTAVEGAGDVVRWCCGGLHQHLCKGAVHADLPAHLHDDLAPHLHDTTGMPVFDLRPRGGPAMSEDLRTAIGKALAPTLVARAFGRHDVGPATQAAVQDAYAAADRVLAVLTERAVDVHAYLGATAVRDPGRCRTVGQAARAEKTEHLDEGTLPRYPALDAAERQAIYDARDEQIDADRIIGVLPAGLAPVVVTGLLARGLIKPGDDSDEPSRWLLSVRGLGLHYRMRQTSEGAEHG